jgi:hypothetical protein
LEGGSAPKQKPAQGIVGRQASAAPAYTRDFAALDIECGRRCELAFCGKFLESVI